MLSQWKKVSGVFSAGKLHNFLPTGNYRNAPKSGRNLGGHTKALMMSEEAEEIEMHKRDEK